MGGIQFGKLGRLELPWKDLANLEKLELHWEHLLSKDAGPLGKTVTGKLEPHWQDLLSC